jgi:hypothetical protein
MYKTMKQNIIVKSKISFQQMQFYYFLSVLSGVSLKVEKCCFKNY